jgi:peptide-methionine (S)-S-oxide reductase
MRRLMLALALALAAGIAPAASAQDLRKAIVAGGCFWCVEADFDKVPGVVETISGYTGGSADNPTYRQVTFGNTGHYEAVEVTFDPAVVSYREILDTFWRTVDPTDASGQFCDRGPSYRTAVFPLDAEQAEAAEASKAAAQAALGHEIVTPIIEATAFWPAEAYHQDYYRTNAFRYEFYRRACGRDARVRSLWGDEAFQGLSS